MKARDVMTTNVVSVRSEVPVREIAKLLLEKGISAVPVVDERGAPLGMVSEGDLLGRAAAEREARRDWWLALLAEGEALNPEFLASLRAREHKAREIMSGPVVTVSEDTDVGEIARLLVAYRVKRVPVIRDGRVVGIVSRADLLRALAAEAPSHLGAPSRGLLAGAFASLDERFLRGRPPEPMPAAPQSREPEGDGMMVADFQKLAADFEHKEMEHREEARRAAAQQRRNKVAELIDHHISDEGWRGLLHRAREAAEHGEKEFMLLRFPSQLCSDGGRAINVPEDDWPSTLRGEAGELYLRWERDLRPHGFHLAARVLEFPGGMPGDIGLFLVWGV